MRSPEPAHAQMVNSKKSCIKQSIEAKICILFLLIGRDPAAGLSLWGKISLLQINFLKIFDPFSLFHFSN